MHELGVVFHVIKIIEEVAEENKLTEVESVTLELGEVSGVIEDYLQKCWKWAVLKKSVHLKQSKLLVETIPAITLCRNCNNCFETVKYGKICPVCNSEKTELRQGNEFRIKEISAC